MSHPIFLPPLFSILPLPPPLGQRAEGSSFRTSCERMGKPSSIYMQIPCIPLPERNWQSMRVIDRHEDVSIRTWLCGHVCVFVCRLCTEGLWIQLKMRDKDPEVIRKKHSAFRCLCVQRSPVGGFSWGLMRLRLGVTLPELKCPLGPFRPESSWRSGRERRRKLKDWTSCLDQSYI